MRGLINYWASFILFKFSIIGDFSSISIHFSNGFFVLDHVGVNGSLGVVGDSSTLPVSDDLLAHIVVVGLSSLQ